MELTTRDEKSLLLYFETQSVDYGGKLEGRRMNSDDFAIAKRWNEAGFVRFGRITSCDLKKSVRDHWCVLSDDAWKLAHAERRARCDRSMAKISEQRIGLDT